MSFIKTETKRVHSHENVRVWNIQQLEFNISKATANKKPKLRSSGFAADNERVDFCAPSQTKPSRFGLPESTFCTIAPNFEQETKLVNKFN